MEIELSHGTRWIFAAAIGVALLLTAIRAIRNRGLKGALFGVPLRQKIAEISLTNNGSAKVTLKVNVLEPRNPSDGPHVGIEVVRTTFASWETRPLSLTRSEARQLAQELSLAANASEAGKPVESAG